MPRRSDPNQRSIRVPGIVSFDAPPPRVWYETWLIPIHNSFKIPAFKVTVYNDERAGWIGYRNNPETDEILKNQLISVWPRWAWKMVLGQTSDVEGPPAPWIEKAMDGPVIHRSHIVSGDAPEKEDEIQTEIAQANYRERKRAEVLPPLPSGHNKNPYSIDLENPPKPPKPPYDDF